MDEDNAVDIADLTDPPADLAGDINDQPDVPTTQSDQSTDITITPDQIQQILTYLETQNTNQQEMILHDRADYELLTNAAYANTFTTSLTAVCAFVFVLTSWFKR